MLSVSFLLLVTCLIGILVDNVEECYMPKKYVFLFLEIISPILLRD